MSKVNKRQCGIIVIEAVMSSPNGCPESGAPRIMSNGLGVISSVSQKKKVRKLIGKHDGPVWDEIKSMGDIKNGDNFHIFESRDKGYGNNGDNKDVLADIRKMDIEELSKRFVDVRLFGCTALEDKKAKESADKLNIKCTGCVQVTDAISVAPIEIVIMSNTKEAPLREVSGGDIAPQCYKVVRHGLYVMKYFINPFYADHVSQEDVDLFVNLIQYADELNPSRSRQEVRCISHLHFTHENAMGGSFVEHDVFAMCTPRLKEGIVVPQSLCDYVLPESPALPKGTVKVLR